MTDLILFITVSVTAQKVLPCSQHTAVVQQYAYLHRHTPDQLQKQHFYISIYANLEKNDEKVSYEFISLS